MKKIVTLTGQIDSKRDWVARKLEKNSDVEYVFPYVGIDLPMSADLTAFHEYHVVLPQELEIMMRHERVLYSTTINDTMYVFFEFQMKEPFSVVVVDDDGVFQLRENWDGEIYSIYVKSKSQKDGGRSGKLMKPQDFDEIFDADIGDLDELEARIYV